jgi:hypothetical protein
LVALPSIHRVSVASRCVPGLGLDGLGLDGVEVGLE